MKKTDIKMAVIMDEFTFCCYEPECEIMQITSENFKQEIDEFEPDIMFIESVWRGKNNSWRFKLNDNMQDITNLTNYCKQKKIPVIFWSKEDPVYFGVFIKTAALADFVFTTDADCIELYKAHLGHDRVYFLPFAAQPKEHNPIEIYERKDKFCFAGSFYVKYKERSNTFIELCDFFTKKGLDIYDRNFKKAEKDNNAQSTSVASPQVENYFFPEKLQRCILGGLPYREISKAYKGYRYGVNMTSMVQSGFMFARRVFELMACNTVIVSNYSRGLSLFFGDLMIATNNKDEMETRFNKFCKDELSYRKYRLLGLRHVLRKHLYEDRLDRVFQKVKGMSIKSAKPRILVVCKEKNGYIRQMFQNQSYECKTLVEADDTVISDIIKEYDFVTYFDENDYYAEHYLEDFALATRFAQNPVIGKIAFYDKNEPQYVAKAYSISRQRFNPRMQMIKLSVLPVDLKLNDFYDIDLFIDILGLDEFNYQKNGSELADHNIISDINLYTGVDIEKIYQYTGSIKPVSLKKSKPFSLQEIYKSLIINEDDLVKKYYSNDELILERDEDDDNIVWLRTEKNYNLSDYTTDSRIGFFTQTSQKLGNVRCQIEYYDKDNKKLGFLNFELNAFTLLGIMDTAKSFKLIIRMMGKSSVRLKSICLSSPNSFLPAPFCAKKSILITDTFDDYTQCQTEASGINKKLFDFALEHDVEVVKVMNEAMYLPYSEYKGVPVVALQKEAIREYLSGKLFEKIYVYESKMDFSKYLDGYDTEVKKFEHCNGY